MTFSIRYSIPMNGPGCQESVTKKLKTLNNVEKIDVDLAQKEVVITGTAPPSAIVSAMQTIGRDAFVRGSGRPNSAAVAILETNEGQVKGLTRIIEIAENTTLFDISLEQEFKSKDVSVFSYGDISNPPNSLGSKLFTVANFFTAANDTTRNGNTISAWSTHSNTSLSSLIGRSIHTDTGLTGIIARSAGLWENDKTVCTCSGKTVWEERKDFRDKTSGNL